MLYGWKENQVYYRTKQTAHPFNFQVRSYAYFSGRSTDCQGAAQDYKQDSPIPPQMQPFTC
jgi:hypothetical protein